MEMEIFSRRVRKNQFAFSAMVACVLVPSLSSGAWSQGAPSSDRDVIIDVKGVSIRLPARGADNPYVTFSDNDFRKRVNASQIIADPSAARKFFDESVQITVSMANFEDREGLFLARFPRSELITFRADVTVGNNAQAPCRAMQQEYAKARAKRTETQGFEDGWTEKIVGRSPATYIWVRSDLESSPTSVQGLSCDGFSFCSTSLCVGKNALFSFQFSQKAHPRATWLSLGSRIDRLIDYILPFKST
jgi:hypothetical protein